MSAGSAIPAAPPLVSEASECVHVLLPVHNRRAMTQQFLRRLRQQTYPRIRLIVIDDGSTDATDAMVHEEYPAATILRGTGHLWWSGSLQRGMDRLMQDDAPDDDIMLIVNDDTTLDAAFVERGVGMMRHMPGTLLGARLLDPDSGAARESGIHVDWLKFAFFPATDVSRIDCLSTRGLFVRWRDAKIIGGFHPRLLPHYWSDYEYTLRARRLGYLLLTHPSVVLRAHPESSGYHHLDDLTGWTFLKHLFSIKTPLNPLYRSSFVWLAAPWPMKLPALINVWARALPRLLWQGLARQPFRRNRADRTRGDGKPSVD